MNEPSDPIGTSVAGIVSTEGGGENQAVAGAPSTPVAASRGATAGGPAAPVSLEPGFETVQLASRLLIGLLTMGGGELGRRLQEIYRDIDTEPELVGWEISDDDETLVELLRYLAVGLFVRGQRRVIRGVRRGALLSLGTAGWFVRRADRLTDNRLMRPIRRPIEARLRNLGREADQIVREGRFEEQKSRMLAEQTLAEAFDGIVELIAESPELNQAMRAIVAGQGVTLASVATDNARSIGALGDSLAEGLVRRLLRRTPRRDLPPSPLLGQPQTMYSSETIAQELHEHDT